MFRNGARPAVVGHRGAPLAARENTPEAFAAAASAGANWVELDVRRCADGLVVHHDPHTTDGQAVVEQTVERLGAAGVWPLQEVLAELPPGLGIDVEVKNLPGEPDYDETDSLVHDLVPLLNTAAGERPLFTSSFNPSTLDAVKNSAPDLAVGLLHASTFQAPAALRFALELGARVLCSPVDAQGLDVALVQAAHEAGVDIMVWTVDDRDRAAELAAFGIDALCTNDPEGLVAILHRTSVP